MSKNKIVLDGTVLAMAIDNKLSRTGIFFVIKNLCDSLLLKKDVELKIITSPELKKKLISFYSGHPYEKCLDTKNLKFGNDKLNLIMPFHPANSDLYKIPNCNIFQIIYDFSTHFCPELKGGNLNFEKNILNSLNSKSHVLCISEKTKSDLLAISKIDTEKVGVFYPGLRNDIESLMNINSENKKINIEKFLNIPENAKYILCLSTIEPRKNLEGSLKVFEKLINDLKSDNLYLVLTGAKGWGESAELIKNFSPEVQKKIRLTGYVEDEYIFKIYKSSLCFLYPSFYEGFGMPPLEAIACGVPVVTSNRGSLPEIFNKVAQVFDPYDYDGMSVMITNWYLNSKNRSEEIKKTNNFIDKFTWKKSSQQVIDFINKFNFV